MNTAVETRIRPLKPGFGAEILDVDLSQAPTSATIRWRGGNLPQARRHPAARSERCRQASSPTSWPSFGEPEDHTLKEFTVPGHPKVYTLSNRIVDGKPIGAHNDGVGWHTDYSYKPEPVMATMLYAVEVPPEGSDTLLADCVAAWNALPPERQSGAGRQGFAPLLPVLHVDPRIWRARVERRAEGRQSRTSIIPLIRTHPVDGRKALWPSTGTVIEVMDMPNPEGLDLVQELVDFTTQDRFVFRHKWRVGDILMWDNRCTLHTGTLYDDQKYIREMHRLWVRGDKPY